MPRRVRSAPPSAPFHACPSIPQPSTQPEFCSHVGVWRTRDMGMKSWARYKVLLGAEFISRFFALVSALLLLSSVARVFYC
jgi:hypothetical protein